MTLFVIAITIALGGVYAMVSTWIFAVRYGQLSDIGRTEHAFAYKQYQKTMFWTETGWGLGFLAVGATTVVLACYITPDRPQVQAYASGALIATAMYVAARLVRSYQVALSGVTPLRERFKLYERTPYFRSTGLTFSSESTDENEVPTGRIGVLPKVSAPTGGLDRDLND